MIEQGHSLEEVQAMLVQLIKSCHQFCLDGGSWKAAWVLTTVEDPYGSVEFGGTEEELNIVAGLLKAKQELATSVNAAKAPYGKGGGKNEVEIDDGGDGTPATAPAPKQPGGGRGRGAGRG